MTLLLSRRRRSLLLVLVLSLSLLPIAALDGGVVREPAEGEPGQLEAYGLDDGTIIYWLGPDDPGDGEMEAGYEAARSTRAYTEEGSGDHCIIYIEDVCSPYPSQNTIDNVIDQFDNTIHPINTEMFGSVGYLKINVYIREMDGPSGTGGFFSPLDPRAINVDCDDINSWGFEIMAHEFQHLIHNNKDGGMGMENLWVNEGCAENAVHFCYGTQSSALSGHVMSFENNPNNDLFTFENSMADYGSTYAFVQYFWDHYGKNDTLKELVAEKANGRDGFNNVLIRANYTDRFSDVYLKWVVANWLDDPDIYSGEYGYRHNNIDVVTKRTHGIYPVDTINGNVQRYGAEYIRFNQGDGDTLRFTGTGNGFFQAIKLGKDGGPTNVTYLGGAGTYDIGHIGFNYSTIIIVICAYADQSYSYSAEFLDATPPLTWAEIIPAQPDGENQWYLSSPSVKIFCNDPGATIYYRFDEGPLNIYSSAITIPEGNQTLKFYGRDISGNQEGPHSMRIKVDATVPFSILTADPPEPDGKNGWYTSEPQVSILAGDTETVYYRVDAGENQTFLSPFIINEGVHGVEYWAVDDAGNKEITRTSFFKVDLTIPLVEATVAPGEPDGEDDYYVTQPKIDLHFDSANETTGHYRFDQGDEQKFTSTVPVPDGKHTFTYWAQDEAGNNATEESLSFTVDTQIPTTTLATYPNQTTLDGWFNVTPLVHLSTDPDAIVYFSLDGYDYLEFEPLYELDGAPFMGLLFEDGIHSLFYYSKDIAGNTEPLRNATIMVDTKPPEVEIKFDTNPRDTGWFTNTPIVTIIHDDDTVVSYQITEGTFEYESPFKVSEGEISIKYWGVDQADNKGEEDEVFIKVDAAPPFARLWVTSEAETGVKVLADASNSSDSISGIEFYKFDWDDGFISRWLEQPTMTHAFEEPGVYNVTLYTRDFAGMESDPIMISVVITESEDGGRDNETDDDDILITPGEAGSLSFFMFLLAVVLIIGGGIIVAVLVIRRTKKKKKKSRPKTPAKAEVKKEGEPKPQAGTVQEVVKPPPGTPQNNAVEPAAAVTPGEAGAQAQHIPVATKPPEPAKLEGETQQPALQQQPQAALPPAQSAPIQTRPPDAVQNPVETKPPDTGGNPPAQETPSMDFE